MQLNPKKNKPVNLSVIKKNTEVVCCRCGSSKCRKEGFTNAGKQKFSCLKCRRYFVENADHTNYKPSYLELGDDVWDASELGIKIRNYRQQSKLVFLYFKQDWFKELAKRFIRYKANNTSYSQLHNYISVLNKFSDFLEVYYPLTTCNSLNREVIIDFIDFLNQRKLNNHTKNGYISTLSLFFETGKINSWFDVPPYLIRQEDYGKKTKPLPRYIPEEVIQQLNQHLNALPEPVKRMVLVLQETGLRIGELLQLPINCLKFDAKKDAYIQYTNWKMTCIGY